MTVPVSAETDVVLSEGEREKPKETMKYTKTCYYNKPKLVWWNRGEKNVSQKLIKAACEVK